MFTLSTYYLQIINPDRSKDVVLKYQIDDTFVLPDNEAELERVANLMGVTVKQLRLRY